MGVDFLRRTAKPFTKRWDAGRESIASQDLFSCEPQQPEVRLTARLVGPALPIASRVVVHADDNRLVVLDETTTAAVFIDPPKDVLSRIVREGGCATGYVVAVDESAALTEVALP